jgi:UDP-2,4-diacetamido-2,4,6-trideoxy-beta-L-altropyranose hydrolase
MKVVFRVDASLLIGSGHVMRCLVLAEQLKSRGHTVLFACTPLEGDLRSFIQSKGFDVITLSPPLAKVLPAHPADYVSWLQKSIFDDVRDFLAVVTSVDYVVTDHYAISHEWQSQVKQKLKCKILAIDDLNRRHCADFILDQNLWPNAEKRYPKEGHQIVLIGPKYALLRKEFAILRKSNIQKKNQVLAFFGNSDPTGECFKVAQAASRLTNLPFQILLVTGRQSKNAPHFCNNHVIKIVDYIADFDLELKRSAYCIGASGISNWERFCLNVPTTIVSVADNQTELSQHLFNLGVVRYLGNGEQTSITTYIEEFNFIASNWDQLAHKPLSDEVDGLGADRVVHAILGDDEDEM